MNEKNTNILLVEDEESHAKLISKSFESASGSVSMTFARNLHEARSSIAKSTPDLIIADFLLPDGKGIELIPANKEESPYPVIILTSHGDEEIAVEAMKADAFDYIVKSVAVMDDMPHICERIMREWNHITERKKAEEEIKGLAKFPGENPNPVLRIEKNGSILYTNNAGSIFLDYWSTQTGQSVPEDWHKHVLDVLRAGKSNNYEMKIKDHIFSITLAPVVEEGYVNFYGLDITEKKKMEEALLQSEKLKSIGTITAGISHEFNNILAIISGNVQLLEASYKDHEGLSDALRIIKRATNDGAEISRRMLKFTKTAKDTAEIVPFDINELINQAIDFTMPRWKNTAQAKGINYYMDTEGMKRVPSILCNPTELREVFVNITNNALDAMPDDGRITFRTWNGEDTVFIGISDTGKGMSEEVMKNIFDPFFTTRTPVGTGLGLSTAYGIVTGHGGKIEVESKVGSGSTFTLQFPVATKTDSPKESPEPKQEIKTNSLRILVVDDEEAICNILDKFLSKKGHLVRTVDNGREAIMLTKIDDYDLVLCDMAMPDVFGYDVIKALNKLEKRPKIGIITGWGEKLKPIDDEGLKVDFIIKKPFDLSELTKHINDVMNAG
ncbi:MAG: response regulator [Candidatus Scalindua sp.]